MSVFVLLMDRRSCISLFGRQVQEYFENTYNLDELLFTAITDEKYLYKCPDRLRLPLIFYLAHPATLYVNKLLLASLISVSNFCQNNSAAHATDLAILCTPKLVSEGLSLLYMIKPAIVVSRMKVFCLWCTLLTLMLCWVGEWVFNPPMVQQPSITHSTCIETVGCLYDKYAIEHLLL
jgi:hypothetical protein